MSQTSSRLLSLLSLLQARRDWPGQLLADRLEVSSRTVRRDVDRLRDLGYPVQATKGPEGGYRLAPGADLPPLLFDDEQAVALAVALQTATASGLDVADAAARALTTVRQVMPARLRQRIDALQVTAVPRGRDDGSAVDPAVLAAIADAVRAREVLRFDYAVPGRSHEAQEAQGEPVPPRRVEPHHLLTRAGRWYLLAFDRERDDWRTFRVDRMTPRTPTGPRFAPREVPGGDVVTFFSARLKGAGGAGGSGAPVDAWPCRGEVVVALPAHEVVPYAGDGVVEPVDERSCRLVAGAWSWMGLAAGLARYDADVDVVGPPELAAAFGQLAERAARAAGSGRLG